MAPDFKTCIYKTTSKQWLDSLLVHLRYDLSYPFPPRPPNPQFAHQGPDILSPLATHPLDVPDVLDMSSTVDMKLVVLLDLLGIITAVGTIGQLNIALSHPISRVLTVMVMVGF